MLLLHWSSPLVASRSAVAERCQMAPLVDSVVLILRHVTVRRALRFSYILRPRSLPVLFVVAGALQQIAARGSAACRRADVAMCHHPLFVSSGRDHDPNTLAFK